MNKYDRDIAKIGKMEHEWVSVGGVGSKDGAWVLKTEIPFNKMLIQRITELETRRDNEHKLLNTLLEARGLPVSEDSNPFYNLYQLMLNSFIIAKDKPMYALELDADGYIKSGVEIGALMESDEVTKITDLFNGCHKIVDGVRVLDEVKLAEMEEI